MDPVATVTQGRLRGVEKDGVLSFKGVPYAASPFGPNRFAAPAPPASWDGTRDAVEFGATAPKPPHASPIDQLLPEPVVAGTDCLNLNVWTPGLEGSRPVLVWIHGGSFVNGSNAITMYDGSRFARDGIVCVSVNYRLGAEGFLLVDGAPANRGLLDQVAALEWVRDNIEAFGGNPAAVTIAGESAGAMSATTLLTMPGAAGLFTRAILQSGAGHHTIRPATAKKVTRALAEQLGVDPTVAGFSSVAPADLVTAQAQLSNLIATAPNQADWNEIGDNKMAFEPTADGVVVPALPIDRIADGVSSEIDVLIGTNTDEHALFLVPTGIARYITDQHLTGMLSQLGAGAAEATYRATHPEADPGELLIAALTDWFFRIPAVRLVEARQNHGAASYVYEFAWKSPQFEGKLGACHALEIGFTFDNLDDSSGEPLAGSEPPQTLADEMHAAWVSFISTGDPGWPTYGDERTVRRFDTDSSTVQDPARAERLAWDGIR